MWGGKGLKMISESDCNKEKRLIKENLPPWEVGDGSRSKAKVRKPSSPAPGLVCVTPLLSELSVVFQRKCECLENANTFPAYIFFMFYISVYEADPLSLIGINL